MIGAAGISKIRETIAEDREVERNDKRKKNRRHHIVQSGIVPSDARIFVHLSVDPDRFSGPRVFQTEAGGAPQDIL